MSTSDRRSTFWVIDGIKIRKKEPFAITYIPRIIQQSAKKQHSSHSEQPLPDITGQFFLASGSYENMADRKVDYGNLRSSSLNELRGSDLFAMAFNQDSRRPPQWASSSPEHKHHLFLNQFPLFDYDCPDDYSEEDPLLL